jgi:hypothetical protein
MLESYCGRGTQTGRKLKQFTALYTEGFSVSPIITSKFRTIAMFKYSVLLEVAHPSNIHQVVLGGVMVIVLTTVPKVRGFKPGRERWILKGDRNLLHNFLRRGSKAVNPLS